MSFLYQASKRQKSAVSNKTKPKKNKKTDIKTETDTFLLENSNCDIDGAPELVKEEIVETDVKEEIVQTEDMMFDDVNNDNVNINTLNNDAMNLTTLNKNVKPTSQTKVTSLKSALTDFAMESAMHVKDVKKETGDLSMTSSSEETFSESPDVLSTSPVAESKPTKGKRRRKKRESGQDSSSSESPNITRTSSKSPVSSPELSIGKCVIDFLRLHIYLTLFVPGRLV